MAPPAGKEGGKKRRKKDAHRRSGGSPSPCLIGVVLAGCGAIAVVGAQGKPSPLAADGGQGEAVNGVARHARVGCRRRLEGDPKVVQRQVLLRLP